MTKRIHVELGHLVGRIGMNEVRVVKLALRSFTHPTSLSSKTKLTVEIDV